MAPRQRRNGLSPTPAGTGAETARVYGPAPPSRPELKQTVFPPRRKVVRTYSKGSTKQAAASAVADRTSITGSGSNMKQQRLTQFAAPLDSALGETDRRGTARVVRTQTSRNTAANARLGSAVLEIPVSRKRRRTSQGGMAKTKRGTAGQEERREEEEDEERRSGDEEEEENQNPQAGFHTQTLTQLFTRSFTSHASDDEVGDSEAESSDDLADYSLVSPALSKHAPSNIVPKHTPLTAPSDSNTLPESSPDLGSHPVQDVTTPSKNREHCIEDIDVQTPTKPALQTPSKDIPLEIPSSQPSPFTPCMPLMQRRQAQAESVSPLKSRSTSTRALGNERVGAGASSDDSGVDKATESQPRRRFPFSMVIQDSLATTSGSDLRSSFSQNSSLPHAVNAVAASPAKSYAARHTQATEVPASIDESAGLSLTTYIGHQVREEDIETQDGSDEEDAVSVIPDSEGEDDDEDQGRAEDPGSAMRPISLLTSDVDADVVIQNSPFDVIMGNARSFLSSPAGAVALSSDVDVVEDSADESPLSDIEDVDLSGASMQTSHEDSGAFAANAEEDDDEFSVGPETQAVLDMVSASPRFSNRLTPQPQPQPQPPPSHVSGSAPKKKARKKASFAPGSPEIMPMQYYTPTPSAVPPSVPEHSPQPTPQPESEPEPVDSEAESEPGFSQYMPDAESQRVPLHVIQAMQQPTNRTDIFISMHPEHAAHMLAGTKNHEFRNYEIHHEVVRLWIYVMQPDAHLRYMATIGPPKRPGEVIGPGIGNDDFNGRRMKTARCAYQLLQVYQLNNPVPLARMKLNNWVAGPPQKYIFVAPVVAAQLLANLQCQLLVGEEQETDDGEEEEQEREGYAGVEEDFIPPTFHEEVHVQRASPSTAQSNSTSVSQQLNNQIAGDIARLTSPHEPRTSTSAANISASTFAAAGTRPPQFKRPDPPSWRRPMGLIPDGQAFDLSSSPLRAGSSNTHTAAATATAVATAAAAAPPPSQATTASRESTCSPPQRPRSVLGGAGSGLGADGASNALSQMPQAPPLPLLSSSQLVFGEVDSPLMLLPTAGTANGGPTAAAGAANTAHNASASLGLTQLLFMGGEDLLPYSLVMDQEPPPAVISDSEEEEEEEEE